MSELRWDPILSDWVITATHRQERTFKPPKDFCPLCPTKNPEFPTEIPVNDYQLVVFENKFPSFKRYPDKPIISTSELFKVKHSHGICEVVLYSPKHEGSLTEYPVEHLIKLINVWTDRYIELGNLKYIKYVFIFENKGEAVGVTLHHPHGQIYAFPFIPPKIKRELSSARKYYDKNQVCLFCTVLDAERKFKQRIVAKTNLFIAFVPFYARYPYEIHIYSIQHRENLAQLSNKENDDLASILKIVLTKYDNLFDSSFPYMMVIHQSPTDERKYPYYHFHIEFYPPMRSKDKLKYLAGCESGAGSFINDTAPEEKAEELRKCKPKK